MMATDLFCGDIYLYRAKRADRIKLIFWDGTGVCLFAKSLEHDEFRWPWIADCVIKLSATRSSTLLEGLGLAACVRAGDPPAFERTL